MTLFHDSHDPAYRLPFGAAECGQTISLSLKAPEADYALLRLYTDEEGEKVLQPNGSDNGIFFWSFEAPGDDVVLWYFFVAGIGDNVYCLGDNDDSLGGAGKVYYQGETPKSFRISVYHPFSVPDWYKEGIVYQIYPDRFARAESDPPLKETGRALGRKTEDWDTPPYYIRKDDGSIAQWNFWGGTLKGIESRLPYIRSLGASVIYLNPIFKARSNHRYDTADYFETDPMLGTEEDFRSLCGKASELGIRIILDGVFNHTGCDSDYFRLHKDWYLKDEDGSVKCWWGVKDLPEIDESNEEFRELICGENGVIRYWLRAGASGWRLDVADELPNDFLMLIRRAVKAEGDDKLVIGEVWEDASYKYDYGARMRFLGGLELDSVMNYPVREDIIAYVKGEISAEAFAARQISRMENYPPEAFYGCFNMLGSHDRERIFTMLGSRRAVEFASALLYVLPGVPVLYYGDEALLEGGRDPENRGTFPWGKEPGKKGAFPWGDEPALYEHFKALGELRNGSPALKKGSFRAFADGDGKLIIERSFGRETRRFAFSAADLSWEELR
ncbi:MAG: glycoside hydrolase family 13 protein [Firmicutes bacterium]|nr:glycoside hydrolase family 13 protein [Bacillota bacterium]